MNYDGSIFSKQDTAGIGVVICNSKGAVMAFLLQQITLPATVAQVEALAIRIVIEFALEISIIQAIF